MSEKTTTPVAPTTDSLAESVRKNFWTFRNFIGKKECTMRLPKPVRDQVSRKLRELGDDATDDQRAIGGEPTITIPFFGAAQKHFRDTVIASGAAIHTHTALHTSTLKEGDPTRLIYVLKAIEFEIEADKLIAFRERMVREFADRIDEYLRIGRESCDYFFPFEITWAGKQCKISDLIPKYTREEFISDFYAYRSEMLPINSFDASQYDHLPAEYVLKKEKQANEATVKQMEQYAEKTLATVKELTDLLAKQFGTGERLHESLKDKAKMAADKLRELADGYNNSEMLRALADTLQDNVTANIKDWETFKENPQAKEQAARAAAAVSKKLGQLAPRPAPVSKPTPVKAAPAKGKSAAGGLLGRKRRKASTE